VWYEAEQLLRASTDAYLIGYSLPNDDLEVIHLLRRGLRHLAPEKITVVVSEPDEPMIKRYKSHFGAGIILRSDGFDQWASELQVQNAAETALDGTLRAMDV
jgi:hypothetical protein